MDDDTCTEVGSDCLSVVSGTTQGTDDIYSPSCQTGLKMLQGPDEEDDFLPSPVLGFAGKTTLDQNEVDNSQETIAPGDENDDAMSSMSELLLSHHYIPRINSEVPLKMGLGIKGDNSDSMQLKGDSSQFIDHSQGTHLSPSILGPQQISQMQKSLENPLPNEETGLSHADAGVLHSCQCNLKDIKVLLNSSSDKDEDVMVKIGKTQSTIIQTLKKLQSSNGAVSSEWKTCVETLKGHLGRIRQRHDAKRQHLALEVKQKDQTKDKKQRIHKELLSLSKRQKFLLDLFQKQKDINKFLKSCLQQKLSSDLSQQKASSSSSPSLLDPRSKSPTRSNVRSPPRSKSLSFTESLLTLSGSSKSSPSLTKSTQSENLNEDINGEREKKSEAEWSGIMGVSTKTELAVSELRHKAKAFSRRIDGEAQRWTKPHASEARSSVQVGSSSGLLEAGIPVVLDTGAIKSVENDKIVLASSTGLKRKTSGTYSEEPITKHQPDSVICSAPPFDLERKKCLDSTSVVNPDGLQVQPALDSGANDVMLSKTSQKHTTDDVLAGNKVVNFATSSNSVASGNMLEQPLQAKTQGILCRNSDNKQPALGISCESANCLEIAIPAPAGKSTQAREVAETEKFTRSSQGQEKMLCTSRKESSVGLDRVLNDTVTRAVTQHPEEHTHMQKTFPKSKCSVANLPLTGAKMAFGTAFLSGASSVVASSETRFPGANSVTECTVAFGSKQTLSYPYGLYQHVLPKLPGAKNNDTPKSGAMKLLPRNTSSSLAITGGAQVCSDHVASGNDGCSHARLIPSAASKPDGKVSHVTECVLTFPPRPKLSKEPKVSCNSVPELMGRGFLNPGQGNLTLTIKGVSHQGSVMQDGRIHTREGIFRTPTGWVSKVTGVKVKKQAAYNKVMFNGVPLSKLRTTFVRSRVSNEEVSLSCEIKRQRYRSEDEGSLSAVNHFHEVTTGNLPACNTSQEPVKWAEFLVDCKVCLISDQELITSDSFLPSNFWTKNFQHCQLSEELWDSITVW